MIQQEYMAKGMGRSPPETTHKKGDYRWKKFTGGGGRSSIAIL